MSPFIHDTGGQGDASDTLHGRVCLFTAEINELARCVNVIDR